jgi:chemotaxis protein CheD
MAAQPLDLHAGSVHVLHPGDVACGVRGDRFETLLGSCVAVILTDPRRTIGAMCHIVHTAGAPSSRPGDTRHADVALAEMQRRLAAHGMRLELCAAYVFGGGNMFPNAYPHQPIGERNVLRVLDVLAAEGVRVLQHDVGGTAYRRLHWTVGPDAPEITAVPV